VLITFHVVTLSWPVFEAGTLHRTGELFAILLSDFTSPGLVPVWIPTFLLLCTPMFVVQAVQLATGDLEPLHRFRLPVRAAVYVVVMVAIVLLGEDFGESFFYFQF
jgi:hypothetical protein